MAAQDAQPFHWHYNDGPDVDDKNYRLRGHGLFFLSVVLFSSLLLLTLFCLYLKWARRRPNIRSAGPLSTSSPDGTTCVPSGLDVDAIKSLPVVILHHCRQSLDSSSEEDGAQCSICLGVLAEGDKVKVLPVCGHTFHPECIDMWLRTHSSCPLCRSSLSIADCKGTKTLDAC